VVQLNFVRTVVLSLLIGSIVTGFIRGLALENTSAVVTSYSTWTSHSTVTSTFRYYWTITETSTQIAKTTMTALTQDKMDGPYLRIVGKFHYRYELGSNQVVNIVVESSITNLLKAPVEEGSIVLLVSNRAETVKEEVKAPFGKISPGETLALNVGIQTFTRNYYHGDVKILFVRVEIASTGVATDLPIATYTYIKTQLETSLRTFTTAHTITKAYEIQEPFSDGVTGILLGVILAGAAVTVLAYMKLRRPSPPAQDVSITAPESSQAFAKKFCMICGEELSSTAGNCTRCGAKQEN